MLATFLPFPHMQGDFRPVARDTLGFAWKAERPDADSFVRQKWGWTASEPGSWVDLVFDTRTEQSSTAAGAPAAQDPNGAIQEEEAAGGLLSKSVAYIGYLRSYKGMGSASVECTANCTCGPTVLEGTWERKASLTQFYVFEVRARPGVAMWRCCWVWRGCLLGNQKCVAYRR